MIEFIFFGRGGQGGVTGAQILVEAAILSGKFTDCSSFPSFGAERRGAPVEAYSRVSNEKIWTRSAVIEADVAVVLDETVFGQHVIDRLKSKAILVVNTPKCPADIYHAYNFKNRNVTVITGDLIQICFDINLLNQENQPIVNTPILGLLSRSSLGLTIADIIPIIEDQLGKGPKSEKNITAAKLAADQAQIASFP